MGLLQVYFDLVYNPIYDFTTGRMSCYRKLQGLAVSRLELNDEERILCVGLGTGNEICHILEANKNVNIVGVDYSKAVLEKARTKALKLGKEITLAFMDARKLEFADGSFDKVLCFHVLDFVTDGWAVTNEILRVLKSGGRFAVTYPSDSEGPSMGYKLMKDVALDYLNSDKNRLLAVLEMTVHLITNMVYVPLLFRKQKGAYSRAEIENKLASMDCKNVQIEKDDIYQDFIVCGAK
ncbi:class I SAM-dependent methyltransferase [Chloroflexota bacterium]